MLIAVLFYFSTQIWKTESWDCFSQTLAFKSHIFHLGKKSRRGKKHQQGYSGAE